MAEEKEEIVIIEDSDTIDDSQDQKKTKVSSSDNQEKKKILLFGGIAIVIVLLLIVLLIVAIIKVKKKEQKKVFAPSKIEKQLQNSHKVIIQPSKLEHMIAKANYLYTTGQKEQALKLYEYIAQYSEAISQYNLGVAKLKNKQYKQALQNFNNAINNGEKRCVSAINAAICCIYLHKEKDFQYYIDLAEAYLPNELNSPLYPYYYSLIKFYQQNYFEALTSIDKVSQKEYQERKDLLKSKLYATFGDNIHAIEALEELDNKNIPFKKAILYANIGDLTLAKKYFQEAKLKGFHYHRALLGLIYTKIKLGEIKSAIDDLKEGIEKYAENFLEPYPIKTYLKPSLFDPLEAQERFRKALYEDQNIIYQTIFYFAPYKIFNANQTINYIRKGNATSYIDSVESAQTFLQKSASTSKVNKGIAQAIKKALHFKIREANKQLASLVKIQPKHSILHYNLALTYAQLGNMQQAYKHFIWAYHLNTKNYEAGVYAYMASKLIFKEDKKLLQTLKETLIDQENNEKYIFHQTLLHVAQEQYLASVDWLDHSYKTRPIYLILSYIIATHLNKNEKALQSAKELIALLPNEIIPHILYIDAKLYHKKKPIYAKETAKYLKKQHFIYNDFFYGTAITKQLFIQENLLIGRLYNLIKLLEHQIEVTANNDTLDMELALAQAYFYNKNFEKSYVEYNHIIDELHIQDAHTLFLGALAAIQANHHENAIALLELSKLKNKTEFETRYALALLYFEINNAKGATTQLNKIPIFDFHSKYFDFDIDIKKLTFKQQHPND